MRELKSLVERLHMMARQGRVCVGDLPADIGLRPAAVSATAVGEAAPVEVRSFEDAERTALREALAAEHGNLSKLALRLGISRPTLYPKLDQHGIRRTFV